MNEGRDAGSRPSSLSFLEPLYLDALPYFLPPLEENPSFLCRTILKILSRTVEGEVDWLEREEQGKVYYFFILAKGPWVDAVTLDGNSTPPPVFVTVKNIGKDIICNKVYLLIYPIISLCFSMAGMAFN